MIATDRKPHVIEQKIWPERYARGWHVLAKADAITSTPQMYNYFGTRVVAYRGEDDNAVHVLDAYCPHMGADLSKGCVSGNSLVCPFHAWSWGADGVCDDIPYAKNIPSKAVIKSWPVLEKNGLLMVWNDPEGNLPIAEQEPAKIDDYYSGEWTDWVMNQVPIQSHCRELVDNMADMAHFGPVHYTAVESFSNKMKGHEFTQFMVGGHEILTSGEVPMTSIAHYEGPAYMTTTMTGMMDDKPVAVHLLVSHIPVSTKEFHINFGVMMKKIEGVSEEENKQMVAEYTKLTIESFQQDIEIWDNKILNDNPVLCDGDGPVNLVRKWYQQFYTDIADISPQMTKERSHVTVEGPSVEETLAKMHQSAA
ncbi:putative 3-ketosteroid-9-alpha-monooxygenase, oxygenase component [Sinobacterium norvegicum]|uniref:3-ketosteroid-9-alpha-monooxygenase, oxygenase component n=1 Tax=Sinobacterium norvegicum TaxID=1641715 RepID=A0ABN8EJ01_9GAMM|nr:Rieske 2Fe-2S domain-containing protein [Sinobacterium norvegicum]CAH0992342.1 putative 3-ketosteroid-9-alpha-monooxygenase, oxygenase component [Sinobacterium norvegicum]